MAGLLVSVGTSHRVFGHGENLIVVPSLQAVHGLFLLRRSRKKTLLAVLGISVKISDSAGWMNAVEYELRAS